MKTESRGGKIRANVYVAGKLRRATFPIGTADSVIMAWREKERRQVVPVEAGSIGADVIAYLPRIAGKPTAGQIAQHLLLWVQELGADRPRSSVTAADIDTIMQRWAVTPTVAGPGIKGRPSGAHGLAAGTIRKRRRTLITFFSTLDGKHAAMPIKGSRAPKAPKAELRGLRYPVIAQLLAAMPRQIDVKRGAVHQPALGYLRAAVMAYTGIPPGLLQLVKPVDIDWRGAVLWLRARDKGAGVEAHSIPLTPDGLAALRAFHAADAYGVFATEALNVSVKRAGVRVGVPWGTFRLYDLRHSFGAEMYRTTHDIATVGRFLGHAEGSPMTARYAKAGNEEVDRAAAAAFLQPARRPAAKASRTRFSQPIFPKVAKAR